MKFVLHYSENLEQDGSRDSSIVGWELLLEAQPLEK
jgi:hypothetical protein